MNTKLNLGKTAILIFSLALFSTARQGSAYQGTLNGLKNAERTALYEKIFCYKNKILFLTEEHTENKDLNGDGDLSDIVYHVHDTATGQTKNLKLTTYPYAFPTKRDGTPWVALSVDERTSSSDYNGDGDHNDNILHLYNMNTEELRNIKYSIQHHSVYVNEKLYFTVAEWQQGNQDLNGDGDSTDTVLHALDLTTLQISNPLQISNLGLATKFTAFENDNSMLYFLVDEVQQGSDYNNDGDALDDVLHGYHTETQTMFNFGYAVGPLQIVPVKNQYLKLVDEGLAFRVDENGQNQSDLNGDGDTTDSVVHFLPQQDFLYKDFSSLEVLNLKLAIRKRSTRMIHGKHNMLAFLVDEIDQGSILNFDGDTRDEVIHFFDAQNGLVTNSRRACLRSGNSSDIQFTPNHVFFVASEADQGLADYNSDGDNSDHVIHSWNRKTRRLTNITLAGRLNDSEQGILLFNVNEEEMGYDFNGDQDAKDKHVLHTMDTTNFIPWNVQIAYTHSSSQYYNPILNNGVIIGSLSEDLQGSTDYTFDGDADDVVVFLYHIAKAKFWHAPEASSLSSSRKNKAAVLVFEDQRKDLNYDGDFNDSVVHSLDFTRFAE